MYLINEECDYNINCGFELTSDIVYQSVINTNMVLKKIPIDIYKLLDSSLLSGMVSKFFCKELAKESKCIVQPHSFGNPDILPLCAVKAHKKHQQRYHTGLEIKCTGGGIPSTVDYNIGDERIHHINEINWWSHHGDVKSIMCVLWDFKNNYPIITAIYCSEMHKSYWNKMNKKVKSGITMSCSMTQQFKSNLKKNWCIMFNDASYIRTYENILKSKTKLDETCYYESERSTLEDLLDF